MIVAVPSTDGNAESKIESRFGRAGQFILYDTETKEIKVQNNEQNKASARGAGIQTAEMIVNSGAKAVITVHCGPKAFRVLEAAGVKIYTFLDGTIQEAITKFESGNLPRLENPNN